jgi:phosphotransferase system enzyme I (PtsI)
MSSKDTTGEAAASGLVFHGVGSSDGIAWGPVFVVHARLDEVPDLPVPADRVEEQVARFEAALVQTRQQILALRDAVESRVSSGEGSVFDAHLMVLDDPFLVDKTRHVIRTRSCMAESAVRSITEEYGAKFAAMQDDYLRERAADLHDIGRRLIRNLLGATDILPANLDRPHIIVAEDLTPSETVALPRDRILAFATDRGSATSHTAIVARALGIPAVAGLRTFSSEVHTGDEILLDGHKGIVVIRPGRADLEAFHRTAAVRRQVESDLTRLRDLPAVTPDGRQVQLHANVDNSAEFASVTAHGAAGIGLYRTEYLWLNRGRAPTEAEQTDAYVEVAEAMQGRPVTIRVLDLGGDKFIGSISERREANPFLGLRSIRYLLREPAVFKAQLRAILRASARGDVRVMYPMVSDVREVILANELLEQCKQEVEAEGVAINRAISVGVMIEIPSAALTADTLAEHAEFFSIGTNDLTQYTLAVDRINENVIHLYQPAHPSVLTLIRQTIKAGHRHGRQVGVCGEMAADPLMAVLLLGMGIDELSMSPSAVPAVKDVIRKTPLHEAQKLARQVTSKARSASDAARLCRRLIERVAPELLEIV